MFTEVALTTSATDPTSYLWDIRSGTVFFSFKQNVCGKGALALAPLHATPGNRIGLVLAAQADKAIKLVTIAASNRGTYCAGGTEAGKIYVWEISTGNLLRSFDAHYKRVSVLRFASDDSALVSGSEDAGVNVWLLSNLLDNSSDDAPTPYYSWSDHTLPISDIVCGVGSFRTARVLTGSLDHTCKIWDLATGILLTTFLLPYPITALALDPAERTFFAAGGNLVYQVDLYRRREARNYGSGEVEAVGGSGRVEGIEGGDGDPGEARLVFRGHSAPITSLALSLDGSLLLSSSDDATVAVWDVVSRQSIRTFVQHRGPVSSVSCFLRPPETAAAGIGAVQHKGSAATVVVQPFRRMRKTEAEERDEGVGMRIAGNDMHAFDRKMNGWYDGVCVSPEAQDIRKVKETVQAFQTHSSTTALQSQVHALQSELVRVHDHHARVRALHDELYGGLVEEFVRERRRGNAAAAEGSAEEGK
ncbi:WD40-repeat-containing domain protein [Jimgerdemannia flammicorona]|uniref:WD40-repeat-containing domain protein n=1 Tax=Jimgerdemannia flammicorona TaxID=994334 RepID=A0A433QAP3_9FUNG|nr:WD40-repeat-containing domain protein [Jimgerdemannia flammicorona]